MTASIPTVDRDGTSGSRNAGPWSRASWAIYLAMIVITIDGAALNLALPTIGREFHASTAGLEWVVNAYTLPLASLLLLAGSLGDRIGIRRLFMIAAAGFGAASLACAAAPDLGALIAFRAAQGVFAAGLLPMVLALTMKVVADPIVRRAVVNLLTVFGGIAVAVGPFVGGLLTTTLGWRAVFWLTAPVAAAAVLLIRRSPEPARGERRPVDVPGQIVGGLGLSALVGGMIEAGSQGWASPVVLALLAGGLIGLVAFVVIEARSPHPMLPLGIFAGRTFSAASAGGFAFQFGAYGLQFLLAVSLQRTWHLDAVQAGLLLLPFAAGLVIAASLGNPRLNHRGPRFMIMLGAAVATVGALVVAAADGPRMWWLLAAGLLLVGLGTGTYSSSLNQVASAGGGHARAGLASGVYNTSRQIGQATGIALLGGLVALPDAELGMRIGVAACAALTVGILVLAALFVPRAEPRY